MSFLCNFQQWIVLILAIIVIVVIFDRKRLRWLYIMIQNLPRDIRSTIIMLNIEKTSLKHVRNKTTLHEQFSSLAKRNPQKIAIYFEDQIWTFAQVESYANKITRYFLEQGFQKGDVVALLLENTPEYPCIFLGLSRLGVVTSLINTNLVKDSLLHCITVVKPKAVIFGTAHCEAINNVQYGLKDIKLYHLHETPEKECTLSTSTDLSKVLLNMEEQSVEQLLNKVSPESPVVYIYTSGTTGLPKASVITHTKYIIMALGVAISANLTTDDVVYSPLPLYHAGGGVAGLGMAITYGATTVIKKKFSASNYFKDCVKYKVTAAQYIGEMCRYVLAAYSDNMAEKHSVRVIFGNGLNPLVWKKFVDKFSIKKVVEIYGSTEGIALLVNLDNKLGSVGYVPWFFQWLNWVILIKCNESGEPIRDKNGRCIKCSANESGLIIGKVNPNHVVFDFKGYTDDKESQKKILHDVLSKGDMYFNSGDVLVYDEYGYFYFKDRMGDTYRWKGENVSTVEVESVIGNLINLSDVIVYGVKIPNTEGRAGMAAIVDPEKNINIQSLGNKLKSNMPSYSIPLFIRVLDSVPLTGTFKLKKFDLREEGYNLNIIKDQLYFFDPKIRNYVVLTKDLYRDIINSSLKL